MDDAKTISKPADLRRIGSFEGHLDLGGAPEGFDALVMADALRQRGGTGVFAARDYARANSFEDALRFFAPDLRVLRFPAWDCLPYDRVSPTPALAAQRMAALAELSGRKLDERKPLLVLTTIPAVMQRVPPRQATASAAFSTRVGRDVDVTSLEAYFSVNGYQRASTVSERGEYAILGGVIDVYTPGADPFYAAVSEGARCQGLEHWLPLLYDRRDTLFDYLPDSTLIALDHQAAEAR